MQAHILKDNRYAFSKNQKTDHGFASDRAKHRLCRISRVSETWHPDGRSGIIASVCVVVDVSRRKTAAEAERIDPRFDNPDLLCGRSLLLFVLGSGYAMVPGTLEAIDFTRRNRGLALDSDGLFVVLRLVLFDDHTGTGHDG